MKTTNHQLATAANVALFALAERADSDLGALEWLSGVLTHNIEKLNEAAWKSPEHYGKLIRRCPKWPGIITPERYKTKGNDIFIKRLKMGTETGLNFSGKQWSRNTPEIRVALKLIDALRRTQPKLPALSRRTATQWWKASRPAFLSRYGEAFEDHPMFAHYTKKQTEAGLRDRASRRKAIVSKMEQAFRSVASK